MEAITIETLWREEKYRVMYHSQRHYNAIRIAMREKNYEQASHLIGEALTIEPTTGSKINACQHMWGYFKKYAIADEKAKYLRLLETNKFEDLLKELFELAKKYHVVYLIDSRILYE